MARGRKKKETVEDRTAKFHKWFMEAEAGHSDNRAQAKKDEAFYLGDQWSAEDKAKLKKENRPALTFNEIFPIVNLVSGFQRQNRSDIIAYNVKGGTREIGEIITRLIKNIMYHSEGHYESSRQFDDGIIGGEGYLVLDVNYTKDLINGDLVISREKAENILPDPNHKKYDMSDGLYVFILDWVEKDRLKALFPKKSTEFENITISQRDVYKVTRSYDYTPAQGGTEVITTNIEEERWLTKKCWWRSFERVEFILRPDGKFEDITKSNAAEIKKLMDDIPDSQKIARVVEKLHYTVVVGSIELENIDEPLGGVTMYPVVPFYAYWRDRHKFGIIRNLRDPQQEKNKRYSQLLHILNTTAHSGWLIEEKSVTNIIDYKQFGSTPGITLTYKHGFAKPEQLTPKHASEGHAVASQMGSDELKVISGVNADLLGYAQSKSQVESGIAMARRQQQGIVILQSVMDNFNRSQIYLGKLLLEYIQKSGTYSEEEMISIVKDDGTTEDVTINEGVPEGDAVKEVKNNVTVGKYGVMIGQGPLNVTTRIANLMYLVEAAKSGVPIPGDVLIEASDLPNKEKIKQRIQEEAMRQERMAMIGKGQR